MIPYTESMKVNDPDSLTISLFAKLLGNKYQYLTVIYDCEYDHFVVEILDPYGEIICGGLGNSIVDAVDDVIKELRLHGKN